MRVMVIAFVDRQLRDNGIKKYLTVMAIIVVVLVMVKLEGEEV